MRQSLGALSTVGILEGKKNAARERLWQKGAVKKYTKKKFFSKKGVALHEFSGGVVRRYATKRKY